MSGWACVVGVASLAAMVRSHAGDDSTAFTLTSSAFAHQEVIPTSYTCDGDDASPPLAWTDPPAGTKSFALIVEDPDAPAGTWVHWVLYNIPAATHSLAEHLPKSETSAEGTLQGLNDFLRLGYGGPCPPPGPAHRYFFKLYAIDIPLPHLPKATKADVERAMEGHLLARIELIGRYQRSKNAE